MTNAELTKRLERDHGQTWCFIHQEPWPCHECDNIKLIHPFLGRCFDCKREIAGKEERNIEHCGCGDTVRIKGVYDYFTGKVKG